MNYIRKNDEKEEVLLEAKFEMPRLLFILYITIIIVGGILFLIGCIVDAKPLIFFGIFFLLIFAVVLVLQFWAIKNSSCAITNKRIKGIICEGFT